jgi:hypothetical protein
VPFSYSCIEIYGTKAGNIFNCAKNRANFKKRFSHLERTGEGHRKRQAVEQELQNIENTLKYKSLS